MRLLTLLLCILPWTWALAQTPDRVYRVSILADGRAIDLTRSIIIPELARLGFDEGRNLIVETRFSTPDKIDAHVGEVAISKPDAIISIGHVALLALKRMTRAIPVVGLGPDFLELGFAESLPHPGRNLTGIMILGVELNAKRLELLHQAVPTARRFAVLTHPSNPLHEANRQGITAVGHRAGVEVLFFDAARSEDYRSAFSAMQWAGAEALAINADPQFGREAASLASLAQEYRLATACQWREMAEQGCLLSYGPNLSELYQRMAHLTARVLRGTTPSDIPIEQPTRFELVINSKTAQALGLTIPPTLLARADDVIE
jgi:putative tryptophan/tyrosine transport system substrate-binding protein